MRVSPMAMLPRHFDEERGLKGGIHKSDGATAPRARRDVANRRLVAAPWPTVIAVLLVGFLTGRYYFPLRPRIPDFSDWARAAPTLSSADARRALEGSEHLPESVATNLQLTHDECDVGFPLLWKDVMKTRSQFEARGGILKSDINNVEKKAYDGTLVSIIEGRLYVKRFHPETTSRSWAVLQSLYQAIITAPEKIPDVEFWFRATDDLISGGHFGLNKGEDALMWLLPEYASRAVSARSLTDELLHSFGFWSWPEPGVKGWVDFRRKAIDADSLPWSRKAGKLFWRGAFLSDFRRELRKLVEGMHWADIAEIDWGQGAKGRIEMVDHCKHKYLASIEGNSGYSGRLKHLLMCRSVTISHKMKWTQHFHGALDADDTSPNQNIIEMKQPESWHELPDIMANITGDDVRAQRIADNAIRIMRGRYLTPASVTCYWRRVLAEYASLQQFTPSMGDGTDFESFILMSKVHWDPS